MDFVHPQVCLGVGFVAIGIGDLPFKRGDVLRENSVCEAHSAWSQSSTVEEYLLKVYSGSQTGWKGGVENGLPCLLSVLKSKIYYFFHQVLLGCESCASDRTPFGSPAFSPSSPSNHPAKGRRIAKEFGCLCKPPDQAAGRGGKGAPLGLGGLRKDRLNPCKSLGTVLTAA